ncbi:hypothetical protein NKDENANG_02835 [Candidatus Entotheonellaceae bacterium PAL068K]
MQPIYRPPRVAPHVLYLLVFLACLLGGLYGAGNTVAAELGPCEPGLVKQWNPRPRIALASAWRPVATGDSPALLQWVGHSSFLLITPAGLRLLTDPNALHPIRLTADLVSVSNLHGTHSTVSQVPGSPQVLWGIASDGTWNKIELQLRDLIVFNLPSYASRTEPENSPIHNSIFVFQMGDLCVVHLGNLRHPLTPHQLRRIGKPDVLMLPADGHWTLSFDDALTVIQQLQPLLVIPMHIDFSMQAESFVQYTAGRYPVRRVPGLALPLSRQLLPAATEIVVFSQS